MRQHAITQLQSNQLPSLATNITDKEYDLDYFDTEVRTYKLVDLLSGWYACHDEKLDLWWAKVGKTGRYLLLMSVVKCVIFCFHGKSF